MDGRTAGAIILKFAYGYTIEPNGPDAFVDLASDAMEEFSYAMQSPKWLVDIVPIRKPVALPGEKLLNVPQSSTSRSG